MKHNNNISLLSISIIVLELLVSIICIRAVIKNIKYEDQIQKQDTYIRELERNKILKEAKINDLESRVMK